MQDADMGQSKCALSFLISAISSTSWLAARQLHEALSTIVLLIAVTTAGIGLYWMRRIKSIESRRGQMRLCDECRHGNEPMECPIPPEERPMNCPKNKPKG